MRLYLKNQHKFQHMTTPITSTNFRLPEQPTIATINQFIQEAQDFLFTHLLQIGNKYYLLTEIEFYIKPKLQNEDAVHNDKYTHGHDLQLTSGRLYMHGSGVDITCGNEHYYGGILLRGITQVNVNSTSIATLETINEHNIVTIIHGPHKVATALFSNIELGNSYNIGFVPTHIAVNKPYAFLHVSESQRIGLNEQFNTEDNFFEKSYRFVGHFPNEIFKEKKGANVTLQGKESILKNDFANGLISAATLRMILGYQPKN